MAQVPKSMNQAPNMLPQTFHNSAPYLAYQPPNANRNYPSGTSTRIHEARQGREGTFNASWYPEYRTHDLATNASTPQLPTPQSMQRDNPSRSNRPIIQNRLVHPASLTPGYPSQNPHCARGSTPQIRATDASLHLICNPSVITQRPRSESTPLPRVVPRDEDEATHRVVVVQDPRGLREVADIPRSVSRRASFVGSLLGMFMCWGRRE
jgi:hypothetical protein